MARTALAPGSSLWQALLVCPIASVPGEEEVLPSLQALEELGVQEEHEA